MFIDKPCRDTEKKKGTSIETNEMELNEDLGRVLFEPKRPKIIFNRIPLGEVHTR